MTHDLLRTELRRRKQRMTAQRELVLRSFLEADSDHLSAEEVYRKVVEKRQRISKATVYRTVDLLAEVGILRKIVFKDGVIRYEIAEGGKHHHHHMICSECGKVTEFSMDLLENLEDLIEKKTGFKINDHQVKFYGVCPLCQKRKPARSRQGIKSTARPKSG